MKCVHEDHLLDTETPDVSDRYKGCLEVVYVDKDRFVFDGTAEELQREYEAALRRSDVIRVSFL